MNKKIARYNTVCFRHKLSLAKVFSITAVFLFIGVFGLHFSHTEQTVFAQSQVTQKLSDYCSSVSGGDLSVEMACNEGGKGGIQACSAYNQDPALSKCKDAAGAVNSGTVTINTATAPPSGGGSGSQSGGSTATTTPAPSNGGSTATTTPTTGQSPSASPNVEELLKQINDQIKKNTEDLNKLLEVLNKLSPENGGKDCSNKDDTQLDFYVAGDCSAMNIVDLYPEHPKGAPAILFFNGGAGLSNDQMGESVAKKEEVAGLRPLDVKAAGFAMYDVGYRLGTSGIYYQLEDVLRGIKHMTENSDKYGIDPSRIIIWGDSWGGSLVMRAAATGKSGARVAVGWSAETNAWIGLFKSLPTLADGIIQSTCIPTDLAGAANFLDLATGGDGKIAEYGQGLNSFNFNNLGYTGGQLPGKFDPIGALTQLTMVGKNFTSIAKNAETITQQIKNKDFSSLFSSALNVGTKTITQCIDDFNAMSPALNASPNTPPSFIIDFENDGLIGPEQTYDMRDKLRDLGIKSDALILPNDGACLSAPNGGGASMAGGCHLGYYPTAVCPSVKFIVSIIQPDLEVNCETNSISGKLDSAGSGGSGGSVSGSGGSVSGGGGSVSGGGGSSGSNAGSSSGSVIEKQKSDCAKKGGTWKTLPKGQSGYCSLTGAGNCTDGNQCAGSPKTN